jgi:hypothetical protein
MRLNLRVTYNDGSAADVTASAADLVAFEQKWDKSVIKFGEDLRMTDLCWLAWHSTKRTKSDTPDFDAWLETIEFVGAAETAELVPLETSQPTG